MSSARRAIQSSSGLSSERLVDLVLASRLADMPPDAIACAKAFLADTLAVGVAGVCNGASDQVLTMARGWGGADAVRVLGRPGVRLSPHAAAVANGHQIHCLEWDSLHEPSVVIALCVTTAALISEIETRSVSGSRLLLALTVGVEAAVLFGAGSVSAPRFFRPSTAGLMGAAMAVGLVRGFGRAQMLDLLGLAYCQVSGTMQAHWEGSAALALQVGIAARAALTAADLVAHGMSGPHDVVDGKFGYFKLIEQSADLDPLFAGWGRPWKITEVAHKPFAAGRATQATLTALGDLRGRHAFTADDIESMTVHVPPLIMLLVGRPYDVTMSPSYARLCLRFVAPLLLREGRVDPRRYTADAFADAAMQQLGERIAILLDDNLDPNAMSPQRIELVLGDGRRFDRIVDAPLGSPARRLSPAQQRLKVSECFEVGGYAGDVEALFAAVGGIENQGEARDLLDLVT